MCCVPRKANIVEWWGLCILTWLLLTTQLQNLRDTFSIITYKLPMNRKPSISSQSNLSNPSTRRAPYKHAQGQGCQSSDSDGLERSRRQYREFCYSATPSKFSQKAINNMSIDEVEHHYKIIDPTLENLNFWHRCAMFLERLLWSVKDNTS